MIRQLRARGYKSLQDVTLAMRPLCILVGANAAGKSNVVDALRFVARAVIVGGELRVGLARPISAQFRPGRVILEGRIIQTDPEQARAEFPENPRDGAVNPTTIGLPMVRDGVLYAESAVSWLPEDGR